MNPTAMNPTESIERHPFEELADEFVLKLRSGQSPSIEHYAQAYPEHAAMIRSVNSFRKLLTISKSFNASAREEWGWCTRRSKVPCNAGSR
ncbi:MAG: hypothetical protein NT168_03700 [Planctomycetota bacterium]|nr:hypothetical protein [Planctomycetota bacterium]